MNAELLSLRDELRRLELLWDNNPRGCSYEELEAARAVYEAARKADKKGE